jgi:aldehyde dehydrogenase (NAD+)
LVELNLFIGGKSVSTKAGGALTSLDPTSGRPWARVADAGEEDVEDAVLAATNAFWGEEWCALSPTRRGRLLMRLGDLILEHADELATLEVRDNGKLYKEMYAQMKVVPDWLYYFGGLADKIEGRVIPLDRQSVLNYTLREPLGVVAVIAPWNSPILLAMMAIAPALAAGNCVIVKPSEFTSASILRVAELTNEAGFPVGVLNVVTGGRTAGESLVSSPDVAKVSFTGASQTGRQVAERVAARLGRYNLELGGKSPNIVFSDADLDAAEAGVLAGAYGAAGQTCAAGSRVLIQEAIFDEFVSRLLHRVQAIKLGDPMDSETQMGPIATEPQLEKIERFVAAAQEDGAIVLAGGERATVPELPSGYFYKPTILGRVGNESTVAQEEIFGPVIIVMPFDDEAEAIRLANATRYGLVAGIWTLNIKRGHRVARQIQAGTVWINLYRAITFNSPYGGYKDSGTGRLNGIEAVYEYMQTKSVWCELSDEITDPFILKV